MPILYSFKFKNIFYTGQTCCLTQVILKTLDKGALQAYLCIVVFHNSIRFKVNKVWLGLVVRQALIIYRGFIRL